jgi:hypothetical protein
MSYLFIIITSNSAHVLQQVGMKTDWIRRDTAGTEIIFLSRSEFSDRIRIRTIYFVSNSDIHHIWIIEIQL